MSWISIAESKLYIVYSYVYIYKLQLEYFVAKCPPWLFTLFSIFHSKAAKKGGKQLYTVHRGSVQGERTST